MHSTLQSDFAGHKVKLLHLHLQISQKSHDRVKAACNSGCLTSLTASDPKRREHKQQQKHNMTSLHQHLHPSAFVDRHLKQPSDFPSSFSLLLARLLQKRQSNKLL